MKGKPESTAGSALKSLAGSTAASSISAISGISVSESFGLGNESAIFVTSAYAICACE
jgi:hypothetical protein